MALPTEAKARKNVPMARGLLDYFPDALAAVADVSRVGNEQHNPGQPMHWAKHLSTDHADCLIRHLVDRGHRDSDGLRHSAKVAWRALALLQTEIEAEQEITRLEDAFKAGVEPRVLDAYHHRQPDQDAAGVEPTPTLMEGAGFIKTLARQAAGFDALAQYPDQDTSGGFDVCCDQPLSSWSHCEGCHSMVCQQTDHCMNSLKTPH